MDQWADFVQRLQVTQSERQTQVGLFLNPTFERLPLPITRHDDPFFPFSKAVVNATRDIVCAYMFDLASFLSMGAAGAVALERSIRYAGRDTLTILHGPFVGTGYSAMADATGLGVDALTVMRLGDLTHYTQTPPYGAFLVDYAGSEGVLPEIGGLFDVPANELRIAPTKTELLTIRLTDDAVLSAGKLDDYAERIREAVEALV